MVRKRSKGAKKYLDSDDEPETESDFEDDPVYQPETKKYSLRQRKRPTFNSDDYEYEEDMLDVRKAASDDDDFEVKSKISQKLKEDKTTDAENVDESVETSEPSKTTEASEEKNEEEQEELVDFEDMIRADIVMNKNRIDYDNVIQKTEIKIQPLPESEVTEPIKKKPKQPQSVNKPKGKRGRKPKRRNSDIELDEPQFLAPQIQENESDEDYHPYKPKRTRKPKARPAGEIDSSILDDFDDYEFEDQNDVDYNPDDDLGYPGLSGLSNYILDKQISDDLENNLDSTNKDTEETNNSLSAVDTSKPPLVVDSPVCDTATDTTAPDTTAPDTTAPDACIEPPSGLETTSTETVPEETPKEPYNSISVSVADTTSIATLGDTTSIATLADTTSIATLADTTDSAQQENSSTNSNAGEAESSPINNVTSDDIDNDDDDVPRQLNEKSGAFEKVSSTSYPSVIQVNETVVNNSDTHVNGSAKHIENPELNIMDCKEEVEEEDDDEIVFIEDERKCEVIILDD